MNSKTSDFRLLTSTEPKEITNLLVEELQIIIEKTGHFPTGREISEIDKTKFGNPKLFNKIYQNGGINHFREIMGYPVVRQPWNEERAIRELNIIIEKTGDFPTPEEFLKNMSLRTYIGSNGGFNHYRKKLGFKIIRIRECFSEEYIINKLNSIIEETGEFPVLETIKDKPYFSRIFHYGGINHFRKIMGYKLSRERWSGEKYIRELKNVISKLSKFPTETDLLNMRNFHLLNEINKHGGFLKARESFSIMFPDSVSKNYRSELMSYIVKRGASSERIVKELITKWCYVHNLPQPDLNVKLSKGNVIEFVCESNLRIGIDVTNTKNRGGQAIRYKWSRKDYHLYLDELWIVVFSDVYTEHDYIKFNKQSPDNVKIMSIETFMKELQISVDKDLQLKIDNFNVCTFHDKDNFVNLNKGLLSKFFKIKN